MGRSFCLRLRFYAAKALPSHPEKTPVSNNFNPEELQGPFAGA